jgi:hypothetical protein
MDRFRKEILVDNEKRMFEFNRKRDMSGVKYFITSFDSNQKPVGFSLKQSEKTGDWKLIPGSVRWLYVIEAELSDAILTSESPQK